ncbi:MAG: hypothetical protein ACRDPA_12005, partial [Solirubrobacteraceae bacterium]
MCPVRILARWGLAIVAGLAMTIGAGDTAHAAPGSSASWSVEPTPTPAFAGVTVLSSVSCGSPRACIAVGYYLDVVGAPVPLAEQWNGSRWAIQPTPDPRGATSSFLFGVSCATPRSCAAVRSVTGATTGTVPLAERWNGIRWTIQRISGPIRRVRRDVGYLTALSCPSRSFCTAAGFFEAAGIDVMLAERWNGARWMIGHTRYPAGARDVELADVSCPSASSCTAVGYLNDISGLDAPLA